MSQPKADMNLLQALFRAGRYAELEARAQAFLAQKPANGRAWHLLGRARLAQGRLQAAREALERAGALLPEQAPVWSDLAVCLNALGDRQAAAACFERSLKFDPLRAEVWANAGRNALELGRPEEAEAHCRRALVLQPGMAEAHFNLGHALKALKRRDEAVTEYRKVLEWASNVAEACSAAALGLLELGLPEEALAACRRALELKPGLVEAEFNLGNALSTLGRYEEAVAAYRRVLARNPNLAEVHSNLGIALWESGRPEEAVAAYRRALQLKPDFAEAHCNLGNALSDLDELDEALVAYQRALELQPGFVNTYYGVVNVLERMKRFDEAIAACRGALELAPAEAKAYNVLGFALQAAGRRDEAIAAYRHAIELKPGYIEAYINLGSCLARMGRLEEAVDVYRKRLQAATGDEDLQSKLLFILNYQEAVPPEAMLAEARAYGEKVASQAKPFEDCANEPDPGRRLRVGLVSGDFGEHPVGHFLANVVANLDADSIKLFTYETFKRKGDLNERLRRHIPHWREATPGKLKDEALARQVREDRIDILIDLAGHTAHNRLPVFAWRPAPVQVAWLGYFATTGLAALDWILADPWVLPPEEEAHFVEKPWRLPDSYYCFTPPDLPVEVCGLPALKNGHITFGCFNNLAKINDRVIACWARVFETVPGSRLFLKTKALGDAAVAADYRARFARHGIAPERLRLEGASPRDEYLAAYHEVHIALDPFPFPGGTTSIEGLWMGVPVLTLKGDRFIGHQGETILHNAGLPDWIAADEDEYVAKAAAFARDLPALARLRAGLRERLVASPLCDAPRFARNLEAALRGMWRAWCESRPER